MEVIKYDKEYFTGKGYDIYGDFPAHEGRVQKIIDMFNPTSVLDIGCAYGFIVRKLLDRGIFAFGIDVSEWCEEQSRLVVPHNFKRHDLRETLPFRDMEFDLLYCEGVLEHIEEDLIEKVMSEFYRVAKRRCLQIALLEHKDSDKEKGHINLKSHAWWFEKMPIRTYLALLTATETNMAWLYKG